MVDDSITDSQLFHGSAISRAFFKKRDANWLRKLKQRKTDDARRMKWSHQWKRANVVGEEEDGCSRLRSLRDIKTLSDRFSQTWSLDYDTDDEEDETGLSASGSLTSVLENKDSDSGDEDSFCCSKQVTDEEQEEVPRQSNNKSSSTAKPQEKPDEKKEDDCHICTEKMDETDLLFKPCTSCGYKMCLFCYNKIDVCPICKTKYEKQTSSNRGEVTFQQRGRDPLPLSSSFQGLLESD